MSKIRDLKNKLNIELSTPDKNNIKYVKTKEQAIIKHPTGPKSLEEDNVYMSPTSSAKVVTIDNNLKPSNENIPVDPIYMSPTSVPKSLDMSKPLDDMLSEAVYMSPVSNQPKLPEKQQTNKESLNIEETLKDGHRNSFLINMSELNMNDEDDERIFAIHEKPPPKLPAKSPSLPEINPILDFQKDEVLPPPLEENDNFQGDYEMSLTTSTYERDGYLAFDECEVKSQIPIFITHRFSDIKKTNSDKIKRIDRNSRSSNSSINSSKSVPASFPAFGSSRKLNFDLADEEDDTYCLPNDDNLEEFDRFSSTSSIGSNDSSNQPMEYDDETPPIPPPKTKANLRKAKLKLLRQKLSTNIGSNYLAVGDHRSPTHQQHNDRKDWINGRPPSMPVSPPPTPPMESTNEAQLPVTTLLTEIKENKDVKFFDDVPPVRPPKPSALKPKPLVSNDRITSGNKLNNRYNYTQVVPKKTLPKQHENKILNSSNPKEINNVEEKSLKTRNKSEVNIGIQTHGNLINKRNKSSSNISASESSSRTSIQPPPLQITSSSSPTKIPIHSSTPSSPQIHPVIPKKPDRFRIKKNLENVMLKATAASPQSITPPTTNSITKPTETLSSEHGTPTLKRKARPKVPPPPPPGVIRINKPKPNVPLQLNANQPPPPRKPAPTRPPPPSDDRIKEATLRRKQSNEQNGISPEISDVYSHEIIVATETDTNPYSDIDFGENLTASPIQDRFVIMSSPSPKKQPNSSKGKKLNRSFTAVANSMRSKLGKYRKNSKPESTSPTTEANSQELEHWVEEEVVYAGIDEHHDNKVIFY